MLVDTSRKGMALSEYQTLVRGGLPNAPQPARGRPVRKCSFWYRKSSRTLRIDGLNVLGQATARLRARGEPSMSIAQNSEVQRGRARGHAVERQPVKCAVCPPVHNSQIARDTAMTAVRSWGRSTERTPGLSLENARCATELRLFTARQM